MKRILIIDDSTAIRRAIRSIIEPMGYDVLEAGDGAEALKVATSTPLDAVLCDIDMPVMDGLTFVSSLRELSNVPQPPIIMCTTHNSIAKISDALGRGANEYIMKPFDREVIGEKLVACGIEG